MKKYTMAVVIGLLFTISVIAAGFVVGNYDVSDIPAKSNGSFVTPTEFNNITGTIRGIYNSFDGTNHFFGLNKTPVAGITLDIDGAVQLGNFAGFPATTEAGAMIFNTNDSKFYYYNGENWRPLDTPDCSTCDPVGDLFTYTCTDDNADGIWVGGTAICDPANYDDTGITNYVYGDEVCATADPAPNDSYCGGTNLLCEPIEDHYETRCVGGDIFWFDDCGNKEMFPAESCGGSGCTNSFTGELLPDGSVPAEHPMHPEYTSPGIAGYACDPILDIDSGYYVGCRIFNDPYPDDSYTTGRSPNIQMQATCDNVVACGDAAGVAAADVPPTADTDPKTSTLCDAGTANDVIVGDASTWQWTCDNGAGSTVTCNAPHIDWYIGDWSGSCLNGSESREIKCVSVGGQFNPADSPNLGIQACLDAGAGDRVAIDETTYLDADGDGVPDSSRSCGFQCTGTDPANSTMCDGDSTGLTEDTPKTVVVRPDLLSCITNDTKCEFTCNSGYHYVFSALLGSYCLPNVIDSGYSLVCESSGAQCTGEYIAPGDSPALACIQEEGSSLCSCLPFVNETNCSGQTGCSWEPGTGAAVVVCQDSDGNNVYDYYCEGETPIDCSGDSGNSSGCFIANTQVTMSDGSTKNIEEVQIGDKLRGNSGINTVLGFHRPILEGDLYSFNGGEFFVNDNHPFMTTDGWKSLNPAKTAQIHGLDLDVTLLKKGDIMITDNGEIELTKISRKSVSGTTQLYNFNLDGDHTYYADGYLVHNKVDWTTSPCVPTNGDYATVPGCSQGATVTNVTYQTQCLGGGYQAPQWDCVKPGYVDFSCTTTTCFVADTKVVMADGTIRNIQDVQVGEYVMGRNGEKSMVRSIHKPKLGERKDNKIYAFNGGRYFVTAEHPFMTTNGWKAIDPVWSMEEHPEMSVISYLKEGDILITEKGTELINSIEFKEYSAETQLYNLMLGDGNHTYYADGYLVHNDKCDPQ